MFQGAGGLGQTNLSRNMLLSSDSSKPLPMKCLKSNVIAKERIAHVY
jgi:hypothetical protein